MKIYQGLSEFNDVDKPILTIGTFDGVHLGHRKIIDRINEIASAVGGQSVLLTFSPHPRQVLSPFRSIELLTILDEKIELLAEAGLQHLIIHPFTEDFARMKPELYIRDLIVNGIKAHKVVVGYDHRYGQNREGDFELIEDLSTMYDYQVEEISVKTIDDINVSSTKIRNAIKLGDIKSALEYLGHKFTFTGMVMKGDQRGRKLGFPTANLLVSPDKIIPEGGVFAVKVHLNGEIFKGMLNIGYKPTIESESKSKTLEVHIFSFKRQIYGQNLAIDIVAKLRDEQKFGSLELLTSQLKIDQTNALKIFSTNRS